MAEGKREWKRVPVPRDLMDKVDEVAGLSGYASSSEFVRDAIRRLLRDIDKPFDKDPKKG